MPVHEEERLLDFLRRGLRYYQQQHLQAILSEPTEAAPYTALILRLNEIGRRNASIDLEIGFVPGLDEAAGEGVYLMQTFAIVEASVDPARHAQLWPVINEINITLPLGAYGIFEQERTIFFKHNSMWQRDTLEHELAVMYMDRQNGMILHQLHQYIDMLR